MIQLSDLSNAALLTALAERGIRLDAREGHLRVNAPSGSVDDALRTELARRKETLLQLLQEPQARPERTIPRRAARLDERIPQTQAQQGMWLLDHFNPGDISYNIPQAFLMPLALDLSRLQHAVDTLVTRHEALRSSFFQEEGKLFQRVSANARTPVFSTDLSVIPQAERRQRVTRLLQEHARIAFDLGVAPLIRFHVFRLGEAGDVLFVNIHHIIADRGSIAILREDLFQLYNGGDVALQRGSQEDNSVQFADYALWAAEQLQSPALLQQRDYWKRKLAGAPVSLSLPHTRPIPAQRTSNGAVMPIRVNAETAGALKSLGREVGATPFMVFLSAFAVLLAQISGAEDFCVGTPITHRKHVELERTVGLFVNTVALRCQLQPQMAFTDVLQQVRATALEAFENSDLPFQSLLRALRPDRRTGRSPIFQVLFIFESFIALRGEEQSLGIEAGTARYDLTLHLTEAENGELIGMFEYCTDMFDESDIRTFAKTLDNLLPQLAAKPGEPWRTLLPLKRP